ncbi:MAG TPA: SRPBCC family protein [Micromonosporaceae bacterium]|nr:SRPBCC family protein [Micromonosporaceae bacterium]
MSSSTSILPAIRYVRTVGVPAEKAFQVFTESFISWWPAGHHLGEADLADVVIEPRVGGRWYEVGVDGSECDWGRVLVWEPPHRLVLTWQISGEWRFDPDPEHASELEIRFVAGEPGQTVVELEHRQIERLVAAQAAYDGVGSDRGWSSILDSFVAALAG